MTWKSFCGRLVLYRTRTAGRKLEKWGMSWTGILQLNFTISHWDLASAFGCAWVLSVTYLLPDDLLYCLTPVTSSSYTKSTRFRQKPTDMKQRTWTEQYAVHKKDQKGSNRSRHPNMAVLDPRWPQCCARHLDVQPSAEGHGHFLLGGRTLRRQHGFEVPIPARSKDVPDKADTVRFDWQLRVTALPQECKSDGKGALCYSGTLMAVLEDVGGTSIVTRRSLHNTYVLSTSWKLGADFQRILPQVFMWTPYSSRARNWSCSNVAQGHPRTPKVSCTLISSSFNWQIAPILLGKLANTLQHHVLTCYDHALNHSWSLLDRGLSQIHANPTSPTGHTPPLAAPLVPQGLHAIFKPSLHGLLHDPSN